MINMLFAINKHVTLQYEVTALGVLPVTAFIIAAVRLTIVVDSIVFLTLPLYHFSNIIDNSLGERREKQ